MSFLSRYPFATFFDDDLDDYFDPSRFQIVPASKGRADSSAKKSGSSLWPTVTKEFDLSPAMDVTETKDAFKVHLSVPGAEKDKIHVDFDPAKHELSIKGEIKSEYNSDDVKEGEDKPKKIISERVSGSFQRRFTLPENADGEAIKANYKNGVLDVSIPKVSVKDKAELRRIAVNADE